MFEVLKEWAIFFSFHLLNMVFPISLFLLSSDDQSTDIKKHLVKIRQRTEALHSRLMELSEMRRLFPDPREWCTLHLTLPPPFSLHLNLSLQAECRGQICVDVSRASQQIGLRFT